MRIAILGTRGIPARYGGFETFAEGELIATDGDAGDIRAPCDDCTVLMPAREPIVGREAVYLTRPIRVSA